MSVEEGRAYRNGAQEQLRKKTETGTKHNENRIASFMDLSVICRVLAKDHAIHFKSSATPGMYLKCSR